jgi:hypothetical protein
VSLLLGGKDDLLGRGLGFGEGVSHRFARYAQFGAAPGVYECERQDGAHDTCHHHPGYES